MNGYADAQRKEEGKRRQRRTARRKEKMEENSQRTLTRIALTARNPSANPATVLIITGSELGPSSFRFPSPASNHSIVLS